MALAAVTHQPSPQQSTPPALEPATRSRTTRPHTRQVPGAPVAQAARASRPAQGRPTARSRRLPAAAMQSVHAARSLRAPLPSDARPVLYTHTCCPYAQRALMALLHKVRRGVGWGGGVGPEPCSA